MATVHIVGAGLAGLSCAVTLAEKGTAVALYEAAPQAGGRCRSYFDSTLGAVIDNGNHLLLSANHAALGFLETIGARDRLVGPRRAMIPFLDLDTLTAWQLDFGDGRIPRWILRRATRVPGTRLLDYLALLPLVRDSGAPTIGARLNRRGAILDRFLEPMVLAVMNAAIEEAAAAPFARVLQQTFLVGGRACRPLTAARSLGETFVEPALTYLQRKGAAVHFGARVRDIEYDAGEANGFRVNGERIALGEGDRLVLCVPAAVACDLVPGLVVPQGESPILNAHYLCESPVLDRLFGDAPLLGLIGGTAQWVFRREGMLSVTVSAADGLIDEPAEILGRVVWRDLAHAFGLDAERLPRYRIVKEKRATFRQTPANESRRPSARTAWRNLFLAGDWTATGLPATIEGSVRSGATAAEAALTVSF
jgi:squalene-associated FAD-dependent desaturase